MIKILLKLLFCFYCYFIFQAICYAKIIEIKNIESLREKVNELQNTYAPKNILVIFTLENTLLKFSQAQGLISEGNDTENNRILKKLLNNVKRNNIIYLSDVIFINYPHDLVDKNIPEIIKDLQKSFIPVIAISKGVSGKINKIDRMEFYKANYLKKIDIDLSTSFKNNDFIINQNSAGKKDKDMISTFYNGLISYNKIQVSAAITNFLIQIKFGPQVIIMVDYNKENLESIERQMGSFSSSIKFIGMHYTGIDQTRSKPANDDAQDLINFWSKIIDLTNKVQR